MKELPDISEGLVQMELHQNGLIGLACRGPPLVNSDQMREEGDDVQRSAGARHQLLPRLVLM